MGGQGSTVGSGKEVTNMNEAVLVLRCANGLIDCELMTDSFSLPTRRVAPIALRWCRRLLIDRCYSCTVRAAY